MKKEIKNSLINVLEGLKEMLEPEEEEQPWYKDFCKAVEELKKTN